MSERDLRDEIEALHAAILTERAKLAVPLDAELSQARTALQSEVEALTAQVTMLAEQREALANRTKLRKEETSEARAELDRARAEIGRREPLGDPLQESRSNWEGPTNTGCGISVLALLSGAAFAMTWWLS